MQKYFPVTRIYSGNNGESHFEDLLIPMEETAAIGSLSAASPVKNIIFREVEPSCDYDFHTAPQKQYIILLDGVIQIETSLGDTRILKSGDILLVEDVSGKGHRTKNLEQKKRRSVFITI